MNIMRITEGTPCLGQGCHPHVPCGRRIADQQPAAPLMDTCDPGDGSRPHYRSAEQQEQRGGGHAD